MSKHLALFVALFLLPVASAGSQGNPEVEDPAGDVYASLTGDELSGSMADQSDIIAAWFKERADAFEVNVRVKDLLETPTFRPTTDARGFRVLWDHDGESYQVDITHAAGGASASLAKRATPESPEAHTTDPTTSNEVAVELDALRDVYTVTIPRSITMGGPSGDRTFSFAKDDVFTNIYAEAYDGRGGDQYGMGLGELVDTTTVGGDFVFGRSASNHNLLLRPDAIVAVDGPTSIEVPFVALGEQHAGISSSITEGWAVSPAETTLVANAGESGQLVFDVVPGAEPGILTIDGGDVPVHILLTPDVPTAPVPAGTATTSDTIFLRGDPIVTTELGETLYLPQAASLDAPVAVYPTNINVPGGTGLRAIGTWTSEPFTASAMLRDVSASIGLEWSGDATAIAVIGVGDLPTTAADLEGTVQLTRELTNSGDELLGLSGPADLPISPGDQVTVAWFLDGAATATAKIGGIEFPAALDMTVEVPAATVVEDDAVGRAVFPLLFGAESAEDLEGVGAVPQAITAGIAGDGASFTGRFVQAGTDSHDLDVIGAVDIALDQDSAKRSDLDLIVRKDGAFVKASRGDDGHEAVRITAFDIERHGRGTYTLHVVGKELNEPVVRYTVAVTPGTTTYPDAQLAVAAYGITETIRHGRQTITFDLEVPGSIVDPAIDGPDLTPTLDTVTLNSGAASIPDDKIPAGGTLRYYRELYEQGIAHTEAYDPEWQAAEILGHLETEYLASSGVYVAGSVAEQGASVDWGKTIVAHNPLGYQTQIGEAVQHGGTIALQPDIALPTPAEDTFADGMLAVVATATIDGTDVTHSTTVLEGTIHADDRWHFLGQPGEALTVSLDTILPDDGWVAFEENGSIVAMPSAQADGVTTQSGWFASFDPEAQDVSGVVLAGDLMSTTITIADGVRLSTTYGSVEDLLAARYLIDYTVADADATRYAGVLNLYTQDRTELGVIYANGDKSAGVGWAGSRADITADAKLEDWWGNLWGRGDSWDITVEAHASQGGKHLRFIAPADVLENSRYQFQLDGQDIATQQVLSDGHTAVMTVEIDHFSLRAVTMKEIVPGVSWIFAAGFGIFGFVAAYEGALLANMKLRSRSAARGVSRTTDLEGVTLRSRAAQAGATIVKRTPPVRQVRCARCQTLQTHRDDATAVCINCRSPMLEAPEALPWN